jgi:hypothetical protein
MTERDRPNCEPHMCASAALCNHGQCADGHRLWGTSCWDNRSMAVGSRRGAVLQGTAHAYLLGMKYDRQAASLRSIRNVFRAVSL